VPLDTSFYSQYLSDITRKNVIYEFTLEYTDNNRNELKKTYPDFDTFDKNFMVDDKFWKDFLAYADKKEIKRDEAQIKNSEAFMKMRLKAGVAQNLWGREEFFRVWNNSDKTYLQAVEMIRKGTMKNIQDFGPK
jgi:carboxyl-terminal processing protease